MDETRLELARRIAERARGSDDSIRGIAVGGDDAAGRVWQASVLQVVLFRSAEAGPVEWGPLREEDGVAAAVDRIPVGLLAAGEGRPGDGPLDGLLANLELVRITEPGLREALLLIRDRHYSAEGREARFERSVQAARAALDDYAGSGLPFHAVETALHCGAAMAARAGEPLDELRLPRRIRGQARVLKQPDLAAAFASAAGLEQVDPEGARGALGAFQSLAGSHLDARLPEAGAALLPRMTRIVEPARRAAETLERRGDAGGAAWALAAAGLRLDELIEGAAPWRERDDYRRRSEAVYGRPEVERLRALLRSVRSLAV